MKRLGQHWKRTILLLLLLALLLKTSLIGWHVYDLWRHATRLRALANNPASLLQAAAPARVCSELLSVERALSGLRADLGFALRPGWLPARAARENLLVIDCLLQLGINLTRTGQRATEGLQPIVDAFLSKQGAADGQNSQSMTEVLFAGLLQARPILQETEQQIQRSYEEIVDLQSERLWPVLAHGLSLGIHYLGLGRTGLGAAILAPALLGEAGPVNYLLLAENSDELRATGGFISTMGLMTLERGKLLQMNIQDSYSYDHFSVDHPDPPQPMRQYMGIDLWATRDGNWSPDFPTTARAVEDLYHLENTGAISAVVAFDLYAVQAVVRAVGPLDLPKYGDQINGDNVLSKMRDYWSEPQPADWQTHRKDFVGVMASAVLENLQQPEQLDHLGGLVQMLKQILDERHIQAYFYLPAAQELLTQQGWDGAVLSNSGGDYVLALDTNMGYNKVNVNVEKRMEYQVTLAHAAAPTARLTITYINHSRVQTECEQYHLYRAAQYDLWTNDCYWNYLRLYVPDGSTLISTKGLSEIENLPGEKEKAVWGGFLLVPAAESRTVQFVYTLPTMESDSYSLLLQKQAGTEAVPVTVRLILPVGQTPVSMSPLPYLQESNVLLYGLDLRQDRFLFVKLR